MMNSKIYGKLAVTNLKNNRKSYIPYILASAFSVMMYFIMDNLYRNRSLVEKGSPLAIMLSYADAVLLIFSIIFLFYINSFLIKRRKKELGIYNILGMGKGHLGKMLFLESVITTVASIIGGILAGILLSKLVYLILLKILHMGGKIEYRISLASTGMTTILFGAIFILIFLYNLLQMKYGRTRAKDKMDHDDNRNPLFSRRLFYRTYNKRTTSGIRSVLYCSTFSCCRNLCIIYGRKYHLIKNTPKEKKLLL